MIKKTLNGGTNILNTVFSRYFLTYDVYSVKYKVAQVMPVGLQKTSGVFNDAIESNRTFLNI